MKTLTINLTEDEYCRLEELALDININEYALKIIKKHIGVLAIAQLPTTTKIHRSQISFQNDNKSIEKDEFDLLKEKLTFFNITQNDIAEYLETSQSSVSYLFQKKHKKSHLYARLFSKANPNNLLYNMYIHKYTTNYTSIFSEENQHQIKKWIIDMGYKNDNLAFIITTLAVKARLNFHGLFSISVFLNNISKLTEQLEGIDLNILKNDDLEYLHDKTEYLLKFL